MRSNAYTLMFSAAITVVLGLLLSVATTSLKQRQLVNIEVDIKKNILIALNLQPEQPGKFGREEVQDLFDSNIQAIVVDAMGRLVESKLPEDLDEGDDQYPIYVKRSDSGIDGFALPISGKGLWSTLYGYLAIEPDGITVMGITFYQHGETPGLGGEVEKSWFTRNFVGKRIVDDQGVLVGIKIIKGKVKPDSPDAIHQVDGISGATMTSKGLNAFLMEDLKTYEPFLRRIREQGATAWDY